MNCLMGGMMPVSMVAFAVAQGAHNRSQPLFWFHMSFVLTVGAAFAHHELVAGGWWLVAHHLEYGMLTVRPTGRASATPGMTEKMEIAGSTGYVIYALRPPVPIMAAISFAMLATGAVLAFTFGDLD